MTFLSSPSLKSYRFFLYIIAVMLVIAGCLILIQDLSKLSFRILPAINMGLLAYLLAKRAPLLKTISYDSQHLYIQEKEQEEVIPLKAIRQVELKTMGGRWEIYFHPGYSKREVVIFLPSLLYPLNFKKTEARIDLFHQAIAEARQTNPALETNIPYSVAGVAPQIKG